MTKKLGYINTISQYIRAKERGMSMEEIQKQCCMDEATVYTWELSYQCYLKRLPLDKAIQIIQAGEIEGLCEDIALLKKQKQIYKKHWLDLCDKILAEFDKDGWCRLVMTREKALEMKNIFEELD